MHMPFIIPIFISMDLNCFMASSWLVLASGPAGIFIVMKIHYQKPFVKYFMGIRAGKAKAPAPQPEKKGLPSPQPPLSHSIL